MGRRHRSHGSHSNHGNHGNHANHGNHGSTAPSHGNHSSHANSNTIPSLQAAITPEAGPVALSWGAALPEVSTQADVEARLKQIRQNLINLRSTKSTEATLSAGSAIVRNPSIADLPDATFNTNQPINASQPNTVASNLNALSQWMRSTTTGTSNHTGTVANPSNDGSTPAPTATPLAPLRKALIEGIQQEVQGLASQDLRGRHRSHWNTSGVVATGHASHSNHSNHVSHANALHNSHSNHTNHSDERLKTNIQELPYGLEQILQLRPVSFDWKDSEKSSFGFIAQEVQKIFPEIVSEDEDGYLQIEYGLLTALLVKALQEVHSKHS